MTHPIFLFLVSCLSCGVLEKTSGNMLGKGWKNVGENVWNMLETRRGNCRENVGKTSGDMSGKGWNNVEKTVGNNSKNVGEHVGKMLEKCWKRSGHMLQNCIG